MSILCKKYCTKSIFYNIRFFFKVKLVETQDKLSDEVTSKANLVHDLAEKIGKKLAAAEQKGAEGEVTKQFSIKGAYWISSNSSVNFSILLSL